VYFVVQFFCSVFVVAGCIPAYTYTVARSVGALGGTVRAYCHVDDVLYWWVRVTPNNDFTEVNMSLMVTLKSSGVLTL
jgi:hypothetical protein